MNEQHPDYEALAKIRDGIFAHAGGEQKLRKELPILIKNAVDFVIDPVRTARTKMSELDKVEKTFIGLKIEHYLRDWLGAPKGLHRDLNIDGVEVDIKNTIGSSWMIPPETFRAEEPCLLIATAKFDGRCWLGLVLARDAYLNSAEGNRDKKRSISEAGRRNIMWLVEDQEYPQSRWDGIDMKRFRQLRDINPGEDRAAEFFRENIGRIVHRSVIQALLHDQLDYMKRVRGNGGARDILQHDGILLLNGSWTPHRKIARSQGIDLLPDETVAVRK